MQVLGYQRTLQVPDLWKMDKSRESATLSNKLDKAWARRAAKAADWNDRLSRGDIRPGLTLRIKWVVQSMVGNSDGYAKKRQLLEQHWRDQDGRKHPSLAWALNDTFGLHFWAGGLFKVRFARSFRYFH